MEHQSGQVPSFLASVTNALMESNQAEQTDNLNDALSNVLQPSSSVKLEFLPAATITSESNLESKTTTDTNTVVESNKTHNLNGNESNAETNSTLFDATEKLDGLSNGDNAEVPSAPSTATYSPVPASKTGRIVRPPGTEGIS